MNDQVESNGEYRSQKEGETPPDLYAARITGSPDTLARIRQMSDVDHGCRGARVEVNPDGTGTVLVYATAERIAELRAAGYKVEQGENVSELGRQRQKEVGQGDRFEGGRVAPHGLGTKPGRGREGGSAS